MLCGRSLVMRLSSLVVAVVAGLVPAAAIVAWNVHIFRAFVGCVDCGEKVGFPFAFWKASTYLQLEHFLWPGLVGNGISVVVVAVFGGVIGHRILNRLNP